MLLPSHLRRAQRIVPDPTKKIRTLDWHQRLRLSRVDAQLCVMGGLIDLRRRAQLRWRGLYSSGDPRQPLDTCAIQILGTQN